MRPFFQPLLAIAALGMLPLGCNKQDNPTPSPVSKMDITLQVPAMN